MPNVSRAETPDVKHTAFCRKYCCVRVHKNVRHVDYLISHREKEVLNGRKAFQRLHGRINAVCRVERALGVFRERGYEAVKIMVEQARLTIGRLHKLFTAAAPQTQTQGTIQSE